MQRLFLGIDNFITDINMSALLTENYITASSIIYKGIVDKDGRKIYEDDADLPDFLVHVYQSFQLNYPKFYKMDNLSKLGWLAAEVLLKDSFNNNNYQPGDVGVVLANTNSSLDDDVKYWNSIKEMASPSLFVYTLPNIVIGEICIRNHFKGEQAFYIQPEFDAPFMFHQVNYLLDTALLKACICGWVEVFEQEYKAVLFLVEKVKQENSTLFSAAHINNIFNRDLV
jgi:hypothetical protein